MPMTVARRTRALLRMTLLLLAAGCTDNRLPLEVQPSISRSVLVTNSTCAPGPCQSVRVLLFPHAQFAVPSGPWSVSLGTLSGPSACLMIPASAQFHITDTGTGVTTTYTWTTSDPASLGATIGSASALQASPSTQEIVPVSAAGWQLTLPGGTAATPAAPCAYPPD
jgi:hypothetical protein